MLRLPHRRKKLLFLPFRKHLNNDNEEEKTNMKKSNKWMKSMIVTTALSFGLMSGGTFAQAAGMDKAKGEDVKAEQAIHSKPAHDIEKETHVKPEAPEQSKAEENQQKAEKKPEEPKNQASENTNSVKPDTEKKAEKQQKAENRRVKSQASEHASETAVQHANENSAVLSSSPTEGSNEQTEEPGEEPEVTESNEADTATDYVYGSDSASTANPEGQDFYIGKLGYGSKVQFDTTTGGGIYFSSDRAEEATYLYGYWFLSGMQIAPDGISPIEWGEEQAALALQTYEAIKSVYGTKVKPVIFIDVEPAYTGMTSYDYANNQLIYSAFIDYLTKFGEGIKPGTYSSPWSWEVSMGEYSPKTPGAYWVAYYLMDIPTDLTTDNSEWLEFPGTDERAEIWQYFGGEDDYNVAWMLP
jgi:hypothetical protein